MRVLIAEDETLIRLDLRGMLEAAGLDVCAEARDGVEAVELAATAAPDLAVLDVKMPRLDGIEAARTILDERPMPIVIVSAFTEQSVVRRAAEAGVFGYLAKPFREEDLLPAIATARARFEQLPPCASKSTRSPRRSPRARRSNARRASSWRIRGSASRMRSPAAAGKPDLGTADARHRRGDHRDDELELERPLEHGAPRDDTVDAGRTHGFDVRRVADAAGREDDALEAAAHLAQQLEVGPHRRCRRGRSPCTPHA